MKKIVKSIAESITGEYMVPYPVAFHTVDIVALRETPAGKVEVLLIQKKSEVDQGWWRFPGGFVDPSDASAEHAAMRELNEETHLRPALSGFAYVGSRLIDDPRYKDSPHKIITSFYSVRVPYEKAAPVPGDDAARAQWFSVDILGTSSSIVNPIHLGLASMLAKAHTPPELGSPAKQPGPQKSQKPQGKPQGKPQASLKCEPDCPNGCVAGVITKDGASGRVCYHCNPDRRPMRKKRNNGRNKNKDNKHSQHESGTSTSTNGNTAKA